MKEGNYLEREIMSRDNPAVKEYVQLAGSRKSRREQGLFVTEGVKLTTEACLSGYAVSKLFMTESAYEQAEETLERAAIECGTFFRITDKVAAKLSQTVTPQGVFGVFERIDIQKQPDKINNNGVYLLLDSLQDPGNIGTIIRTAAAFGVEGVFVSSDCTDLFAPKTLRASMGGVFKLPIYETQDLGDSVDYLRTAGIKVWAAALHTKACPVTEINMSEGRAVVIGNEGVGLTAALISRCDGAIAIPMHEGNESLNAAMAAGIILWEMTK